MKPYYEDGSVTIYHGDALELLPDLKGGADVLITDPPYGIAWTSHGVSRTSFGDRKKGDFNGQQRDVLAIENDGDLETRDRALTEWGDNRPAVVFGSLFKSPPSGTRHVAVYVKPLDAGSLSAFGTLRRDVEGIYILGSRRKDWGEQVKTGRGALPRHEWPPTKMRSSAFRTNVRFLGTPGGLSARCGHPHVKPGDVLEALITELVSNKDWVILDPFAGSGSTLVAAKNLGRKAIGIELEERYCQIAAERCSQEVLDLGAAA